VFPAFAIACGEEASDPLVLHENRVVRVDELAASGHPARMDEDLAAVAALGVRVWRYGMPWRLTEPAPGVYDWTLWDRALDACVRHGLEPVVDWCHFGLPDHYPGFCAPDWVEGFCRYVEAFLARYPAPRWFTPVNEPGITALFSARYGIWNDRRRGEVDYARALAHVTLANLEAIARIAAASGSARRASPATSRRAPSTSRPPRARGRWARRSGTCTSACRFRPRPRSCTTRCPTPPWRGSAPWRPRATASSRATTSTP
jgi:hypothetical protein